MKFFHTHKIPENPENMMMKKTQCCQMKKNQLNEWTNR